MKLIHSHLFTFILVSGWLQETMATEWKVVSQTKIWSQGKHNAFTDLIRFRDCWYCVFREADAHVGGEGSIRVLKSSEGKHWKSVATLKETGIDLRDPKLSITPKNELMLLMGGSVYQGKTLLDRQPRVAFSKEGTTWSPPEKILKSGDWLWRVTWFKGVAYGVSYVSNKPGKQATDQDWQVKLYQSKDGKKYSLITTLEIPGKPNETTLRFTDAGKMLALVRRESGKGWIGTSEAPYRQWTWKESTVRLGGPNFLVLPDESLWATSRIYAKSPRTALFSMTLHNLKMVLEFPSGGDTSYAGMVYHQKRLWISYYASHEGKSAIYLTVLEKK